MSYNGVGEYYAYQGMGAYYALENQGMGGLIGFGSIVAEFNAAAAWSDWLACANAYQATQTVVPQCKVVDLIRAGLGELGYGPLGMGASWSSADISQMKKLATDHGLDPGNGMPREDLLQLMESLLKAGKTPGGKPTEYEKVGHTYVPVTNGPPPSQAGMGAGTWLLIVAAVGGVGYLAYKSAKKKKGARPATKPMALARGTKPARI